MLIYLIVLSMPLVMGLLQPVDERKTFITFWLYFVLLLLFCGFRFEVGADWGGYRYLYDRATFSDFGEIFTEPEPGFFLLNKASEQLGWGFEGVIFVCSAIFLYGCFRYAIRMRNPWLAIAVVMPYLIFVISLSGIRQSCAIGLGLYLFANWDRSSLFGKLIVIALAISIHNSAAVLLLFVIFGMQGNKFLRISLACAVGLFVLYRLNQTEAFEKYKTIYVDQDLVSEGAYYHVALVAFPAALYLYFRKRFNDAGLADTNVFLASLLALALTPLLAVSSTGVDRLTLYFSFVQMWVYPALLDVGFEIRPAIKTAVASLVLATFLVYFLYGLHASTYIPYRNILLE